MFSPMTSSVPASAVYAFHSVGGCACARADEPTTNAIVAIARAHTGEDALERVPVLPQIMVPPSLRFRFEGGTLARPAVHIHLTSAAMRWRMTCRPLRHSPPSSPKATTGHWTESGKQGATSLGKKSNARVAP